MTPQTNRPAVYFRCVWARSNAQVKSSTWFMNQARHVSDNATVFSFRGADATNVPLRALRLQLLKVCIHAQLRVHASVCCCRSVHVCDWVIVSRSSLTSEVITAALRFTPIRQNKRRAKNKQTNEKQEKGKWLVGKKLKWSFSPICERYENRFKLHQCRKAVKIGSDHRSKTSH